MKEWPDPEIQSRVVGTATSAATNECKPGTGCLGRLTVSRLAEPKMLGVHAKVASLSGESQERRTGTSNNWPHGSGHFEWIQTKAE